MAGTPVPWMMDEAHFDDWDDEETTLPLSTAPMSASSSASPLSSLSPHPGMTSPSPRLPGYIPGMARPLMLRNVDSDRDDGMTGYSTTPRARSPMQLYHWERTAMAHELEDMEWDLSFGTSWVTTVTTCTRTYMWCPTIMSASSGGRMLSKAKIRASSNALTCHLSFCSVWTLKVRGFVVCPRARCHCDTFTRWSLCAGFLEDEGRSVDVTPMGFATACWTTPSGRERTVH